MLTHKAERGLKKWKGHPAARIRSSVSARRLRSKGERLELAHVSGPWQSSGCWWDGRSWDADEWDAIVVNPPQALRLRHEPQRGNWYVAGQYD